MKKLQRILSATFFLMAIATAAFAQGPGFDPDIQPYAAPIDGGAGFLAAAGVIFILRKMKKKEQEAAL